MAVSLVTYPVVTSSGKVRNIFAGFDSVELEFKREDASIVGVSQAPDNKILIDILGDITASLNVGEWVYLYAEGATYTYDSSFQILDVTYSAPNTEITVEGSYIEISSTGYVNYKQIWYLESKLVSPANNNVLNYPQLLQNDGNPNGEVTLNTSMIVDFLQNEIFETSQEITNGRLDCKVMYRETWREDDTATFTLIDEDPIIIIYASENSEIEDFVNGFEVPKIWDGYPFYINILHSLQNYVSERVNVSFDELDINEDSLTLDNNLSSFDPTDFGILQSNIGDSVAVIDDNTRYIRFNSNSSTEPDYDPDDYEATDYETGT